MGTICYGCFQPLTARGRCPYCGFDPNSDVVTYPQALPHGSLLGNRYRSGKVLAQDWMGWEYLALDEQTGTAVSLKEFFPQGMTTRKADKSIAPAQDTERALFEAGRLAFVEEYRRLSLLSGTPHLIHTDCVLEENGTAYAVMERNLDPDLSQRIADRGILSLEEAESLLLPLMDTIATLHKLGMLHGGLCPEAIFIGADGNAKLGGFSMAQTLMGRKAGNLNLLVHPGYSPPEQYPNKGRQGEYSDVYSFAAVLYHALVGKSPEPASSRSPARPMAFPLDSQLAQVLATALSLYPEIRYQTMPAFHQALTAAWPQKQTLSQDSNSSDSQPATHAMRTQRTKQHEPVQQPSSDDAPTISAPPSGSGWFQRKTIPVLSLMLLICAGVIVFLLARGNGEKNQPSSGTLSHGEIVLQNEDSEQGNAPATQQPLGTPKPTVKPTVKPKATATPQVTQKPQPTPEPTEDPRNTYLLPDSATRYLTEEDLAPLTAEECCFARNEIFARHGRIFKTPEIADYFASKTWYHGTVAPERFDDKVFNEFERANVQFIQAYEVAHWGGSYY